MVNVVDKYSFGGLLVLTLTGDIDDIKKDCTLADNEGNKLRVQSVCFLCQEAPFPEEKMINVIVDHCKINTGTILSIL